MHDKSANTTAARRRHVAHGRKISLSLGLLCAILAYVGWVVLTPRITAYELSNNMMPVCTALMHGTMYKVSDHARNWEKEWKQRHRRLGVKLNADQFLFTTSDPCHPKQGCSCHGEAVFELSTPWFLLEDYLDIPPYKTTHHVIRDVEYKTSY